MAKTLKTESGASLIEILITLVIIAVTALIILAFSRNTIMMSQDARANDTAYLAAEEKIADLGTMVFQNLPETSSDEVTLEGIAFTRNWTVDQSGYVVCATVTVSWSSLKGTNRQITLAGAIN
ncbi:MAG: hypothetical protein JW913_03910 [Chitinispirillaceae bacterium]|nr:hypothetical protein [Chitinispirillaceae bacterium]